MCEGEERRYGGKRRVSTRIRVSTKKVDVSENTTGPLLRYQKEGPTPLEVGGKGTPTPRHLSSDQELTDSKKKKKKDTSFLSNI